jgi:hypothetical protein
MSLKVLWVCGKTVAETDAGRVWEIQGIFDSEENAVAACHTSSHWVGPMTLNEELPDELMLWPGCYYPIEHESKT